MLNMENDFCATLICIPTNRHLQENENLSLCLKIISTFSYVIDARHSVLWYKLYIYLIVRQTVKADQFLSNFNANSRYMPVNVYKFPNQYSSVKK